MISGKIIDSFSMLLHHQLWPSLALFAALTAAVGEFSPISLDPWILGEVAAEEDLDDDVGDTDDEAILAQEGCWNNSD